MREDPECSMGYDPGCTSREKAKARPDANMVIPAWTDDKQAVYPAWVDDPANAMNWTSTKKCLLVVVLSCSALLSSIATSIISPAHDSIMAQFDISSTVAVLPITLYVLGLACGPILGGPLSETIGRYPIVVISTPLGAAFTLGCGFTNNFGSFCFLRLIAGLCWGPSLAIAPGSFQETFDAKTRGKISAIYILMPFLGPGLGPVIGSFVTVEKSWRWTQWVLLFFAAPITIASIFTEETYPPVIQRRLAKKRQNQPVPPLPAPMERIRTFARVALIRPVHMLFTEPIVSFTCLYVAVEFGTLFTFFGAVPYTFGTVYHFSAETSGLVFCSLIVGCLLGFLTIVICDTLLYRPKIIKFGLGKVPPEHRLYPAMIGSIGLPLGLFWFAWTARENIHWASPVVAILPFGWGNICVFVSAIQYIVDTYKGSVVASASSSNSLARYGFAAVFPLFTLQMYENLGIDWAGSILGFVGLVLLPIPFVLYKYGPMIRARSQYETIDYSTS